MFSKKSIDDAMRHKNLDSFIKNRSKSDENLMTEKQLQDWKLIDDEWQNYDIVNMTSIEAAKLIQKSKDNAAKRKRMGFASTAQLRLIEYKAGLRQPRSMTAKEAAEKIAMLKK